MFTGTFIAPGNRILYLSGDSSISHTIPSSPGFLCIIGYLIAKIKYLFYAQAFLIAYCLLYTYDMQNTASAQCFWIPDPLGPQFFSRSSTSRPRVCSNIITPTAITALLRYTTVPWLTGQSSTVLVYAYGSVVNIGFLTCRNSSKRIDLFPIHLPRDY